MMKISQIFYDYGSQRTGAFLIAVPLHENANVYNFAFKQLHLSKVSINGVSKNYTMQYTVTRRTVKFPYIHMMTPDDNGPGRENISRMRAG